MPEAMVLYGALVVAVLVFFCAALRKSVERWRREAAIERRVRARQSQMSLRPEPYLILVADGPRARRPLRREHSVA